MGRLTRYGRAENSAQHWYMTAAARRWRDAQRHLGLTMETVSRTLTALETASAIEVSGNRAALAA
jgi:hypothetical protein